MPKAKPNEIEITYSKQPRGQVGPIPRKLSANSVFRFTTKDPGTLTIEFTGASPMADGSKTVKANTDLTAAKTGKFKFKCTLEDNEGNKRVFGDPKKKSSGVGGELEVGP